MWIAFHVVVIAALALDLGVFHRRAHAVTGREAAVWSAVWMSMGLGFGGVIYHFVGAQQGTEYLTAYLVEKALSVDNLFVFVLVFTYFRVPAEHQHRVLFWGVIGAIVMRGTLILGGIVIVNELEWVLYFFGALLVYSGIKMLRASEDGIEPDKNPVLRWARRLLPLTEARGPALWVREPNERGRTQLLFTPLFIVLIFVEISDLLFAVDSIPAVFAVTRDPMVAYTSNIFAILGLRALYFLVAIVVSKLKYLKIGLSAVLVFIGGKMLIKHWYHVDPVISLAIVGGLIFLSTAASLLVMEKDAPEAKPAGAESGSDDDAAA